MTHPYRTPATIPPPQPWLRKGLLALGGILLGWLSTTLRSCLRWWYAPWSVWWWRLALTFFPIPMTIFYLQRLGGAQEEEGLLVSRVAKKIREAESKSDPILLWVAIVFMAPLLFEIYLMPVFGIHELWALPLYVFQLIFTIRLLISIERELSKRSLDSGG